MSSSSVLLCFRIIAYCRISKKQVSSAERLLVGRRYRDIKRGIYENFFWKWTAGGRTGRFQFFLMRSLSIMLLCVLIFTVWWWLTPVWVWQPKQILVIVLSVLCGSVPLYWHSNCSVCHWLYAPPQPLYPRVGMWCCSGWLIRGNHCTCSRGLVRLLLSSSDGLRCEESDHINVLGIQAVSKPH